MILSNSNKFPNYAATIRRVDAIVDIPGMDKLAYARIGVEQVLVSKDTTQKGDIVVFVPQESVLAVQYLVENNLYTDTSLNANAAEVQKILDDETLTAEEKGERVKRMRGYFNSKGRVTLLKIRNMYSPGYVATTKSLEIAYPILMGFCWEDYVGLAFDTIGKDTFCWKYFVEPKAPNNNHKRHKGYPKDNKPRFDCLIPQNFPAHYNTAQLRDSIQFLEPKDVVDITIKIHGTSFIAGYVRCNRPISWWEKVKKFFGCHVSETEYKKLYSSRNRILNRWHDYYEEREPYYTVFKFLEHHLIDKNMIVYGEICGFNPGESTYVQKGHDYGCAVGEWKFMPYRIVDRNVEGDVVEYNIEDVIKWTNDLIECLPDDKKKYIMPLNRVFHGALEELVPFEQPEGMKYEEYLSQWRADLYARLQNSFGMEEDEPMCNNKVPREGMVIRKENDPLVRAFKLKSNAHYALEKKSHDAGEIDMEEAEESQDSAE